MNAARIALRSASRVGERDCSRRKGCNWRAAEFEFRSSFFSCFRSAWSNSELVLLFFVPLHLQHSKASSLTHFPFHFFTSSLRSLGPSFFRALVVSVQLFSQHQHRQRRRVQPSARSPEAAPLFFVRRFCRSRSPDRRLCFFKHRRDGRRCPSQAHLPQGLQASSVRGRAGEQRERERERERERDGGRGRKKTSEERSIQRCSEAHPSE